MRRISSLVPAVLGLAVIGLACSLAWGNGGPFTIKHPDGDVSAKGVLARIDRSLMPQREARLEVVKEDLTIRLEKPHYAVEKLPPLASVSAAYTIKNPTDEEITVEFGFPILRGIYMLPLSMTPRPDAHVTVAPAEGEGRRQSIVPRILSNSLIYGIIRREARDAIEKALAEDEQLAPLIKAIRAGAKQADKEQKQQALRRKGKGEPGPAAGVAAAEKKLIALLVDQRKWDKRDATLLADYAKLEIGPKAKSNPPDREPMRRAGLEEQKLLQGNLGPLAAIGEQKATQVFAQLCRKLAPTAAGAYEKIFEAWGGDVRTHALDVKTRKRRPRELELDKDGKGPALGPDRTVYARVDYFDENAKLTEVEKAACKRILKNLDMIFTFAPMNLLYYQAKFPANKTVVLTVRYRQHCFVDTKGEGSYQLAYVLHPASLWESFGPIHLTVRAPHECTPVCTVKLGEDKPVTPDSKTPPLSDTAFSATIEDAKGKTGDLLIAIDKAAWRKALAARDKNTAAASPTAPTAPPEPDAPVATVTPEPDETPAEN